ncbi:MAG TPA: class I SAM-dependent methyltransferase, partial [Acidobacteriota bacterium]|nr:class I SAM-dependent methyltransferase [Acidobacteriota bacterium]
MLRHWIIDDIYQNDQYGANILADLQSARRFNKWLGDALRPHVGDRVLEIGAGIGSLTSQFIPRDLYLASDINSDYLDYLRSYSIGKPYLRVLKVDATQPEDFLQLEGQFDTVLLINVLEHLSDEHAALANMHSALIKGGRAIVLVPQSQALYGSLDKSLMHRERYSLRKLRESMEKAHFRVETIFDFNRSSAPGWYINGKLLGRKRFSKFQIKALEFLMPAIRRVDCLWPWKGISLIAVGVKEEKGRAESTFSGSLETLRDMCESSE